MKRYSDQERSVRSGLEKPLVGRIKTSPTDMESWTIHQRNAHTDDARIRRLNHARIAWPGVEP